MLCYAILCYAMLCYAILSYVMICYHVLCYAMLCYAMLYYVMLCYAMMCYAMLCYTMLCYTNPTNETRFLNRFPEQRSDKVYLVAGKYYYIRAYQKADKLGDCVSVAVELPSGHFEGPIKRKHLSWKLPGKLP